ncbi:MAG: polysaccharide deacetylase family protein [Kiritimatiellae bacterium]|nr:polysaccharide deacetylase family protein [Kiritimatiellia bacterium]
MSERASNRPPPPVHPKSTVPPPDSDARIRALKASYLQSWLYFFLVVSLLAAWWVPFHIWMLRKAAQRAQDRGPRDAYSFLALSYAGISDQEREVTPDRFREHIEALKARGYVTLTLEEARQLIYEGKPVPRGALLLTFDQSRKSSYFDARSVLRRAGYHGVMFIWTRPILEGEPSSLRWPYVRRMLRVGGWEIGAQSHDGFSLVPADPAGTEGHFLTTPQWLTPENRYETLEQYAGRLAADHLQCLDIIEKQTGTRPRAFAFPYGDFGQYDDRAVLTRRLNLDLVGQQYDLGFVLGSAALNTRDSDPRHLTRLMVQSDWTAEELVQRLRHAWPRDEYSPEYLFKTPLAWLPDWGVFSLAGGAIELGAATNTTGAKAWINGSDTLSDFTLSMEFSIEKGQLGLFLRGTADGERYIYLGMDEHGQLWLRQKSAGMQPVTLASRQVPKLLPEKNHLEVSLRESLIFIRLNGQPLFLDVLQIHGKPVPGMAGLSVWHPDEGAARAQVSSLHIRRTREAVVTWTPTVEGQHRLTDWISRNGDRISHLAPPWMSIGTRGVLTQPAWDARLFKAVAGIYHLRFTPEVLFEDNAGVARLEPESLAGQLDEIGAEGVLLDFTRTDAGLAPVVLTAWLQKLHALLAEKSRLMIVRLPRYVIQDAALKALMTVLPNLRVATSRDPALAVPLVRLGDAAHRVIQVEEADPEHDEAPLGVYYQLGPGDSQTRRSETESPAEIWRRRGQRAFLSGSFQHAIEIWTTWQKEEPYNEEPLMLIGDVYLRRGDIPTALQYYQRSLDISPGQIGLVIRMSRLMNGGGEGPGSALALLDQYAAIFPNDPEILLGKAEWLARHDRHAEAGELIRRVLEQHPDNLQARSLLHGLLTEPRDRYDNLRKIVEVGSRPGMEMPLISAVRDQNLLARPESWILMDLLEKLAARAGDDSRELLLSMLPRARAAREDFRHGALSPDWISSVEVGRVGSGRLLLAADPFETEAYVQLTRSEGLHSGYIEAVIDQPRGFFWLYARRSAGGMVRFGFDQEGQIYLQIWRGDQIIANETQPWTRPDGPLRLRLELRGDGAQGYVEDQPIFRTPVSIPIDLGLGWWGAGAWAAQFGVAQVTLREIEGGPRPIRLASFHRREEPPDDAASVEMLKPRVQDLSTVAPFWYRHEMDGTIRRDGDQEFRKVRIFARYHRLRLLPVVRLCDWRNLDPAELARRATEEDVDGFTLTMLQLPPPEWLERAEQALLGTDLTLLAVFLDEDSRSAMLREISAVSGLFPGARKVHMLPILLPEELAVDESDGFWRRAPGDAVVLF